jgi:mRNA interferase HigB
MHVISKRRLREFWTLYADAERPLRRWFKTVSDAVWESFADVRAVYAQADQVGRFTVFNIGGNKYRLIAAIHYNRGKVFVRHVLTHKDYDKGEWRED